MNIILFGPPGAGKGTQGDKLVKDYNLFKISSGDLLREEVHKNSILGKKIKIIIEQGLFVPDDLINTLIEKILINKKNSNRFIFDGYPRNLIQAKNLETLMNKYVQKISCVLSLKVNESELIKRISGRQTCSKCGLIFNKFYNPATNENHKCDSKFLLKRSDDNTRIIKRRFETYKNQTFPILNFYKSQNLLHEIDGMRDISLIYKEICQIITSLET